MAEKQKTVWNKFNPTTASPPVKKAFNAYLEGKAGLEAAIAKSAKSKGLVEDGQVVRFIDHRGMVWGAVDPRSAGSQEVEI